MKIKDLLYPHFIVYNFIKYAYRDKFESIQLLRNKSAGLYEESLQGFDIHKCIFIHIPKTAGVSLSHSLFGDLGGGHRPIYKYYKIYSPSEFKEYFKFTIVRNPWDRLVSAYHFLKEGGFNENNKKWFADNLSKYNSFEDFVMNLEGNSKVLDYIHFIPQYKYITICNNILVDKVYKYENIPGAIKDINSKLNIDIVLKYKNATINRDNDYRSYYNNETRLTVQNIYKVDIRLFNYSF